MRVRSVALILMLLGSGLAMQRAHGQTPAPRVLDVRENVGLPAIEEGIIQGETHGPETPDAAMRVALHGDRAGSDGAAYVKGKVIVKFRDGATTSARLAAVSSLSKRSLASRAAALTTRPANADFDILAIDPNEDAEAVSRELSNRPDVEYAQPAYRVHPMFVPNDAFYQLLQWNMRLIN